MRGPAPRAKKRSTAGAMISASVLPGLYAGNQRPEAIDDDVHGVANFDEFFFALHGARHVELLVEGDEFERTMREFAVIAHGHDEIHAEDADALPFALDGAIAQPLAGNVGPDLIFHPRLFLVADPAGFAGKNERRLAFERDDDVNVAMNDFESGGVEDRAFESGVLVAADDERVEIRLLACASGCFCSGVRFLSDLANVDLSVLV